MDAPVVGLLMVTCCPPATEEVVMTGVATWEIVTLLVAIEESSMPLFTAKALIVCVDVSVKGSV